MSSHEKSPQAVATGERAGLNTHENHTTWDAWIKQEPRTAEDRAARQDEHDTWAWANSDH